MKYLNLNIKTDHKTVQRHHTLKKELQTHQIQALGHTLKKFRELIPIRQKPQRIHRPHALNTDTKLSQGKYWETQHYRVQRPILKNPR